MPSNPFNFDPDQVVSLAPATEFSPPFGHPSVLPHNNGDNNGGLQDVDVREVSFVLAPAPVPSLAPAPSPVPVSVEAPANVPFEEICQGLADVIAQVPTAGPLYAAEYHKSRNPNNPPPADDLMLRDLDARKNLGEIYEKYHQGSPNAVTLRLLADPAGQAYPFEEHKTLGIDIKGNFVFNRKCGADDCTYRCSDHKRHSWEKHVKDPRFMLCCPYHGCTFTLFGGSGRQSELRDHCERHEEQNTMRLSVYRFRHIQ